jgi:CRISPR-associated protein Cst1
MIENKYIKITGDPFIDTGGLVIKRLSAVYPDKDIYDLVAYITNVYVKNWSGKLHTFFLNSSITQPAFKSDRKVSETLKYYKSLLEETNEEFQTGFCRVMGEETRLYKAGRHNHMMSASGSFINFHSAYENGLFLSKEALIRIYFVPYGVNFVGDKIALIQSNVEEITERLVTQNVTDNENSLAQGISDGTLKSDFGMVSNALFNYANFCISQKDIFVKNNEDATNSNVQINLYHFTNFGASPDVQLYSFSNLLFRFYAHCQKSYPKEWSSFVNQHYRYSKFKEAQFDEQKQQWFNKKDRLNYEEYKSWFNPILYNLLENKPILSLLLKWVKKHSFNFNIVELYCINILKMEKDAIKKIKELSDFILEGSSDDDIKKAITKLNGVKNSSMLRSYLLKLIKKNYDDKKPEPLITVEDFVLYLIPEGYSWKNTRDILLISIYQKLHEMNKHIEVEDEDEEEESKK